MWLTPTAILDEHLPPLHHLNIMVLRQRLGRVKVEKWSNSTQNPFNILRVCFKLICTNALVNLLEATSWVFRGALRTLLDELLQRQPIFRIDVWVMIQCVQEDQAVG